jgi:hypothetical protein
MNTIVKVDNVGVKHLQGCGDLTFETVCGMCDTFTSWTYEEADPTCEGCIKALHFYQQLMSKKNVDVLMKRYRLHNSAPIRSLDAVTETPFMYNSVADEYYGHSIADPKY